MEYGADVDDSAHTKYHMENRVWLKIKILLREALSFDMPNGTVEKYNYEKRPHFQIHSLG